MVTETLIRKKFVHETMTEGIQKLYESWRPAVSAFQRRTGQLYRFAYSGSADRYISEGKYEIRFFIPLHLRFLDIQYRRNKPVGRRGERQRNLYNKIVWPIFYKEIFPSLRYGLTDEVREELRGKRKREIEI